MIRCAHCKGRHETVAQVKLCAHRQAAPAPVTETKPSDDGRWDARAEARQYEREMAAEERGEERERYM